MDDPKTIAEALREMAEWHSLIGQRATLLAAANLLDVREVTLSEALRAAGVRRRSHLYPTRQAAAEAARMAGAEDFTVAAVGDMWEWFA